MREYNKPEVKILNVELTDIICTSGGLNDFEVGGGGNAFIG